MLLISVFILQTAWGVICLEQQNNDSIIHQPDVGNCPQSCSCEGVTFCDVYYLDFKRLTWPINVTIHKLVVYGGLKIIPKKIENIFGLTSLDLSKNLINKLSFLGLKDPRLLRDLSISDNNISVIHSYALQKLTELMNVDLSRNKIRTWPQKTFSILKNVRMIDLSYNEIRDIPSDSFRGLLHLRVLRLDHNNIYSLRDTVLSNLPRLSLLSLESNKIWTLKQYVISELENKSIEIDVSRNPLDCSCGIRYFHNFLSSHPEKFTNRESIQCETPFEYRGLNISDLEDEQFPCVAPNITFISGSMNVFVKTDLSLKCTVEASPKPVIYWVMPWGKVFRHESYHAILSSDNITGVASQVYEFGLFKEEKSVISVSEDGTLNVHPFHYTFHGTYTCVVINSEGLVNSTVNINSYSAIHQTYIMCLIVGGITSAFTLAAGLIIGAIKLCILNFCRCDCVHRTVIKSQIEIIISEHEQAERDNYEELDEDQFDNLSLQAPLNSPVGRTPRSSPMKCPTPTTEPSDRRHNISETLDEVKARLEKKLEKVRSRVHSMRESGSLYLSSIKDTGSSAASRMRAGVATRMELVKSGVLSMKEFCGTGDMGNQTISIASVDTDVKDQENAENV